MAIIGTDCVAYYHVEASEGTAVPSVAYDPIAHHTEIDITYSADPVTVIKSGGTDPTGSGAGAHMASVSIKGAVGPDVKTFLITYGTSTSAVTLVVTNGTQYYTIAGCKVKSYSFKASAAAEGASALEYSIELEGWTVTMTQPSTTTFNAVTSGFTNWTDITMTVGGGAITWRSFEFNVTNVLDDDFGTTGARTGIFRGTRSHDGKIVYSSPATVTDFTTLGATTTKTIVISATGLVLTATNAVFTEVAEKVPIDKIVTREISWKNGGALTIAAS